jgi:hypothetical protein
VFPYAIEGAVVTLLQEQIRTGELIPIGRATVIDGEANIDYFEEPDTERPLLVSTEAEDHVAVSATFEWPEEPQK